MSEEAATLAVVVARLDDVRADLVGLASQLAGFRSEVVARGEWDQRNQRTDEALRSMGREIGDLRTELRLRRTPWPSVVSAVAAIIAAAVAVVAILN